MGLLEKAQQRKVTADDEITKENEKEISEGTKLEGLYEKAQQRKVMVDNKVTKKNERLLHSP